MRSTTARLFCVASAATILAFAPRLRAQDGPARPAITEREPEPAMHAVWAELGGAALLYSVNYEFRPVPFVGLSGGLAVVPFCLFDSCHAVPIVPVTLRALIGYEAHALELGAGVTVALMDDDDARFLVPQIGYRFAEPEGGFLFRLTFTPLFRMNDMSDVLPWGGVSGGVAW